MKYLTVDEVAAVLRVSKRTAYRLVQNMIRVEVGGSLRVPEDALTSYLRPSTGA